jgi:hypothetical protein
VGGPGHYAELQAPITGVSGGDGSFSDRKSLLGDWRHTGALHTAVPRQTAP